MSDSSPHQAIIKSGGLADACPLFVLCDLADSRATLPRVNTQLSLHEGGSPFFCAGNEIGIVLVHGFTGTPYNMRWFADSLYKSLGCTIYAPRLTGHGTRPEDMRGVRWEHWYADVLAAYTMLRDRCDKVFVAGLSMGAVLSLTLAAREQVDGVIAMSTPYEITDWRAPFLPLIRHVVPYRRKVESEEVKAFFRRVADENERRTGRKHGHSSYTYYPTESLIELNEMLGVMRESMPRITAPTLLIHSRHDDVVPFSQLEQTAAQLFCDKQVMVVDRSLHVITMDVECDTVFDSAAQFILAHTRP